MSAFPGSQSEQGGRPGLELRPKPASRLRRTKWPGIKDREMVAKLTSKIYVRKIMSELTAKPLNIQR